MNQLTITQLKEQFRTKFQELSVTENEPLLKDLAEKIALEVLLVHDLIPDAERRVDADVLNKDILYAIPDEALDLIPSLTKALISGLTGNALDAIPDLVGILYRYRILRVEISAEEALVLRALAAAVKSGGGSQAPADIHDRLTNQGIKLDRPVAEVLKTLKAKNTEKVSLVREVNSRWTTGNV